MHLKLNKPFVSVDWLYKHLQHKDLILLDATIPKVTVKNEDFIKGKIQIKRAVFFDIKNIFSDSKSIFPNTVLSPKDFEIKARNLGINNTSCIIVYDNYGVYSSPRVWWMFQLMGFTNIAVLNGGLPKWKLKKYPIEQVKQLQLNQGDFNVSYQPQKIKFKNNVLEAINSKESLIVDARSKGRFYATEPEPRKEVRGGHMPNAVNLPISKIINDGIFTSKENLKTIFNHINPTKKEMIFSCGSGITAAVLALAAEIVGFKNYAVYDGSWTEWGSTNKLPIEI